MRAQEEKMASLHDSVDLLSRKHRESLLSPKSCLILYNATSISMDMVNKALAFIAACVGVTKMSDFHQCLSDSEMQRVRSLLELRLRAASLNALKEKDNIDFLTGLSCDSLRLSNQSINAGSIMSLCEILPTVRSLRSVNLSEIDILGHNLNGLGRVVQASPQVKSFIFQNSNIDDCDVASIAAAVRCHARIETIDLRMNPRIGQAGAEAILHAVRSHVSLRNVLLDSERVPSDVHLAIQRSLETNRSHRARILVTLCTKTRHSSRPILPNDIIRLLDEALHGRDIKSSNSPQYQKMQRREWDYIIRLTRFCLLQTLLVGLVLLASHTMSAVA